jgi:site-specific recombinase XerD
MLRLADLEQSKNAVLHSLGAASSQESYGHAIDEFIGWYCSEPRLAFNRTVVLRYRFFLEQKNLAPSTINVRLAAVRRLAYEASDTGLLSPDLAAGIRRVKGAKRLGARIGNWLTVDQSRTLLGEPSSGSLRGKRDRVILALFIGCGLRRAELVGLGTEDFQIREERCVIADLVGKGKHIRTVPVPHWAKRAVDEWTTAAGINGGAIFRRVSRLDKIWGDGITPKAIWHVVKSAAKRADIKNLAPHDLRRYAESEIMPNRDSKMPSNPRESCRSSVVRPGPCGIIRCASQDMDEAQHSPSIVSILSCSLASFLGVPTQLARQAGFGVDHEC